MNQEQHQWLVEKLKINVKHAEVDTDSENDRGFIPKAKGAEYEGEESNLGWRAGKKATGEKLSGFQEANKNPDSDHLVTRHFSHDETRQATRRVDTEGTMRDAGGKVANEDNMNYVVDPKTGEMVVGAEKMYMRDTETQALTPTDLSPSTANKKAYDSDGKLRAEANHHTSMLRGEDVASAGKVTIKDGKVERISNESGHYKPEFVQLLQVVEHLVTSGAMLDTELVDHEGKSVKDHHPKAFALHQKLMPLLAEMPGYSKRLKEIVAKLDQDDVDATPLLAEKKALDRKVDAITKGLAALRKMGIGPRNEMTGKVDFAFINQNMTGAQARSGAQREEFDTKDFLMGKDAPIVREQYDNIENEAGTQTSGTQDQSSTTNYKTVASADGPALSNANTDDVEEPNENSEIGSEEVEMYKTTVTGEPSGPKSDQIDSYNTATPSDTSGFSTSDSASVDTYKTPNTVTYNTSDTSDQDPMVYNNDDTPAQGDPIYNTSDTTGPSVQDDMVYNTSDPEDTAQPSSSANANYQTQDVAKAPDSTSNPTSDAAPQKPYRDFDAKGEMLDELREKTKGRRPENWDEDMLKERGAEVAQGTVPNLDKNEWDQTVENVLNELDDETAAP